MEEKTQFSHEIDELLIQKSPSKIGSTENKRLVFAYFFKSKNLFIPDIFLRIMMKHDNQFNIKFTVCFTFEIKLHENIHFLKKIHSKT